ncbi:retinol dehydrogenase 7-like isoform X2 [Dermacentor andersoni]|uniref:retinol dehydrogenase 7-like isoform X2 n=1 Tax=Dermacentor andersoni TaxID=34620 RepID=UPI002416632F|nr:retinol dehydrogenase 7-like isoform X2 [Dermacentor andersoni]
MLTINRLLLLAAPCTWALASAVPVLEATFANLGFTFIAILVAYWSLWHCRRLFFNELVSHKGKAVLITGCDTGFGHLLAERLAKDGFIVFAGCLDASGTGARLLKEETNIHVLQMNVTKQEDIDAAAEIVEKTLDNKARLSVPECLAYCISKRASISLADGLRQQFYSKGVHVCTVEPTGYRTPVADHAVLEKVMDADLQQLPEKTRSTIDERFVQRLKSRTRVLLSWFLRNDCREAVDVIRRATLDRLPKAHYTAGGIVDHIYRLLIDLLPAEMMDEALHIMRSVATLFGSRTQ